jgi:hypothetical protein
MLLARLAVATSWQGKGLGSVLLKDAMLRTLQAADSPASVRSPCTPTRIDSVEGLKRGADAWTPYSAIRFDVIGQRIDRILDYVHCPWVIEAATTVTIGKLPQV